MYITILSVRGIVHDMALLNSQKTKEKKRIIKVNNINCLQRKKKVICVSTHKKNINARAFYFPACVTCLSKHLVGKYDLLNARKGGQIVIKKKKKLYYICNSSSWVLVTTGCIKL